nr:coat protein [Daphne virus X]
MSKSTESSNSASDPTTPPSLKDLQALQYTTTTTAVATPSEIQAICEVWKTSLKVPAEKVPLACWDLARAFADTGASSKSELSGDTPALPNLPRKQLAQAIKMHCTIRQFCMYFANIVWNILVSTGVPPANWQRLSYKEETKFAAFDFFDGVGNPAALMPKEGLIREPSALEIAAHATGKQVALHRDNARKGKFMTNAVEVTHGTTGASTAFITLPE